MFCVSVVSDCGVIDFVINCYCGSGWVIEVVIVVVVGNVIIIFLIEYVFFIVVVIVCESVGLVIVSDGGLSNVFKCIVSIGGGDVIGICLVNEFI